MLIKIHKSYRDVVSICDSDLLGKFFEENEFQLDVKESFYNGEEKTEEEVSEIIQDLSREDATFNIVGEKSINLALEEGIIENRSIKRIENIPFSMVLL